MAAVMAASDVALLRQARGWPSWSARSRAQDPARSVALVRAYQQRTADRDALIRMLVHCAGKFQGDV